MGKNVGGRTDRKMRWLKDKYGLSWQIVPDILGALQDNDAEKAKNVMNAMLQMDKLDIEKLKQAYERGSVEVDGEKKHHSF